MQILGLSWLNRTDANWFLSISELQVAIWKKELFHEEFAIDELQSLSQQADEQNQAISISILLYFWSQTIAEPSASPHLHLAGRPGQKWRNGNSQEGHRRAWERRGRGGISNQECHSKSMQKLWVCLMGGFSMF